MSDFITEALNTKHFKKDFKCGNESLDNYIQKQAKQDVKRKLSACFVLPNKDDNVIGFYTLSNAGISRSLIPEEIRKKLPKNYNSLPVTLLGRLAVDESCKGKGIGKVLLMDALKRSYFVSKLIGSMAMVVDPLNENAVNFYKNFGFVTLPSSKKMFLSMKIIENLVSKK